MATTQDQNLPRKLLLGCEEVAAELNVGRSLVWALIQSGRLPSVRLGRRRLVRADVLARFVEQLTAEQQTDE